MTRSAILLNKAAKRGAGGGLVTASFNDFVSQSNVFGFLFGTFRTEGRSEIEGRTSNFPFVLLQKLASPLHGLLNFTFRDS